MATKDQIKKAYFMSLVKGSFEPAVNDVVLPEVIIKSVYKKFQYDLTRDEFNEIGDELEQEGYFLWNSDGCLALTGKGLEQLEKFYRY